MGIGWLTTSALGVGNDSASSPSTVTISTARIKRYGPRENIFHLSLSLPECQSFANPPFVPGTNGLGNAGKACFVLSQLASALVSP